MNDIFSKNLEALESNFPDLVNKLKSCEANTKFDIYSGENPIDLNIFDKEKQTLFFDHPAQSVTRKLDTLSKLAYQPFLYLYGVANGILLTSLLTSEKLRRLVVLEPEIELIYIFLNLFDVTQEINSKKLTIIHHTNFLFHEAVSLITFDNARVYAKVYQLIENCNYYHKYHDENIAAVNKQFTSAFHHAYMLAGNDIVDSIVGVKQTIASLPIMISSPSLLTLSKNKNTDIAVIVATGPSLTKQIPLLKKIAPYVTIFAVDASLPMLEKEGIKPDVCTSIERVERTSEFFLNTSAEFKKDIIFALASLQHEKTFERTAEGTQVLIHRPFDYNRYFELDQSGYIGSGQSCANLAHELIFNMYYKTCLLIGQDLAYARDGKSHTSGHIFGDDEITESKYGFEEVEAYGGEGLIRTTYIWRSFLKSYEQSVAHFNKTCHGTTVNCTEGGARITGTVEMSFEDAVEKYVSQDVVKKPIELVYPTKEEKENDQKKIIEFYEKLRDETIKIENILNKTFLKLADKMLPLEHANEEEVLKAFTEGDVITFLTQINVSRDAVFKSKIFSSFYHDSVQSVLINSESQMVTYSSAVNETQEEKHKNTVMWIIAHKQLFFTLSGQIHGIFEKVEEEFEKIKWR